MAVYRHCPGCGRAFDQKTWQRESFCSSCGDPFKTAVRCDEPQQIPPYPAQGRPKEERFPLTEIIVEAERLIRRHPIIGGLSIIGAGAGCIAVAPMLLSLATGLAWIGGIITCGCFLSAGYDENSRGDAVKGIALGLLLLTGAFVLVLAAHLLVALGIAGATGGIVTAGKGTAEVILRRRIEQKLHEKDLSELIDLSSQLN